MTIKPDIARCFCNNDDVADCFYPLGSLRHNRTGLSNCTTHVTLDDPASLKFHKFLVVEDIIRYPCFEGLPGETAEARPEFPLIGEAVFEHPYERLCKSNGCFSPEIQQFAVPFG